MPRFLREWMTIVAKANVPQEQELVSKIEEMARRCRDEPHYYIRFIGD
jgi:hypothetical protein